MQFDQANVVPLRDSALKKKSQKLVEPAEFCDLLLSRKRFVRCDRIGSILIGLLDPDTHELFQVEEDSLRRYVETQAEGQVANPKSKDSQAGR